MTFDTCPILDVDSSSEYFDTFLKRLALKSILSDSESILNCKSKLPSILSSYLLEKSSESVSHGIIFSTQSNHLKIEGDSDIRKYSDERIREIIVSQVQKITFQNCSLLSKQFYIQGISFFNSPFTKLDTLIMRNVLISLNSEFLQSFSVIFITIKSFLFSQIQSSDSSILSDEIFFKIARDYLSKNPFLRHVDLRDSGIDLMTPRSKRNLMINFPAEMRRWSRKICSLAFESEAEICKIFRILHRQTPVLSSLCIRFYSNRSITKHFDTKDTILGQKIAIERIEPLKKLKKLCLFKYSQVNNEILRTVLLATTSLTFLNIAGCSVSFENYCNDLPQSLSHLIMDQCDRTIFLEKYRYLIKKVFKKCPLLKIYISDPVFDWNEFDFHGHLRENDNIPFDSKDDGLKAFELRIISLNQKACSWAYEIRMFGILDFDKKLSEISDTELLPHLSLELARIAWDKEKEQLFPKFSSYHQPKFHYDNEIIGDFLIKQQERVQDVVYKFTRKFEIASRYYDKIGDKVDVSVKDSQLFPTVLLSSFAAFASYRSRPDSFIVSKLLRAACGAVICSLICHEGFRSEVRDRTISIIPDSIKSQLNMLDTIIGQYGANIWIKSVDFIDLIKNKSQLNK